MIPYTLLPLLCCGYLFTAETQNPVLHTYELQAPGKSPQTFIYYEDEATWLMIKTNKVNKQIYFVAKEPAYTLTIIKEPFMDLMPLFVNENIIASDELGSEDYTLTESMESATHSGMTYELSNHREKKTYRLTIDPSVETAYAPHAFHKLYPALRPLGLITRIEHPDGAVETLVEREDSAAVVADAIEKVQTVLADESYVDIKIMYDDYGAASFRELAEKMRAKFKEMGY